MKLPKRVKVKEVLTSRYSSDLYTDFSGLHRPASWDQRLAGKEVIITSEGEQLNIVSSGSQSTPQVGWVLLLTSGDSTSGYSWTLYGMPNKN